MPKNYSRQEEASSDDEHDYPDSSSAGEEGAPGDDGSLGDLLEEEDMEPAPSRHRRIRQRDASPQRIRRGVSVDRPIVVSSDASASDDEPGPAPRQSQRRVVQSRPKSRGRNQQAARATGPKSKQWTYTINNPTPALRERLPVLHVVSPGQIEYHVFQYEAAPGTGTLHVQGFICFAGRKQRSTVSALLGGNPHLEVTRGSPVENRVYCSSPEKRHEAYADYLFEWGTLPAAHNISGPKDEMLAVKRLLEAGERPDAIAREDIYFANVARHHKFYDRYYNSVADGRKSRPYVFVFYGATGMGKTFAAEQFKNAYFVPTGSSGTTWFDGFDPRKHQTVVFNEMHGSRMQLSSLLELMDKHEMEVNKKGSYVKFNPKCIVFTSNLPPNQWYGFNDPEKTLAHPYDALERRFGSVWEYMVPDTVGLIEAAKAVIGDLPLLGIAKCHKGRNDYHPCCDKGYYKPFTYMDQELWAIPNNAEIAEHSVEEISDAW